jgi:lipopolysaccharide/colanic/teichoic acid biosynthesis glycosyltransferase
MYDAKKSEQMLQLAALQSAALQSAQISFISPWVNRGKRVLDVCLAIIAIICCAPLVPLIALAIKIDNPGPVFYSQTRLGRSFPGAQSTFDIFKFRSMLCDAEADGQARLASKGDVRITKVGRLLRKTRIDELPQLINILQGDMSFIGPRPERPQLSDSLSDKMPFFSERTYGVLPGLTGLAQINQGYLDSVDNIDQKLSYDHAYCIALSGVKTWLLTDIRIFFSTVITLLKCNG